MKKTLLHIIDDFGRGGAETMLIAVLKQLKDYNNIVVTLFDRNSFGEELECDAFFCLHLKSASSVPAAAYRLRKIIKTHQVDAVHSHLFWGTLTARLGVPKKVPLISTIHSSVASSLEYKPLKMQLIEYVSYRWRPNTIVTVTKNALDQYFALVKVATGKSHCLYTFVDTAVFTQSAQPVNKIRNGKLSLVTVGNLKSQKNQQFLLDAFAAFNSDDVHLDIYGDGPMKASYQAFIDEHKLNITLKGQATKMQSILPQYDVFVMSSFSEGFALSVLEAMAIGLPVLLSDIPSFKEQCENTALYFSLQSTQSFIDQLEFIKNNPAVLNEMKTQAQHRVANNFTLQHYMSGLRRIYDEAIQH